MGAVEPIGPEDWVASLPLLALCPWRGLVSGSALLSPQSEENDDQAHGTPNLHAFRRGAARGLRRDFDNAMRPAALAKLSQALMRTKSKMPSGGVTRPDGP